VVVVEEHGLSADRAGRIRTNMRSAELAGRRVIRRKLIPAYAAKIFLIPIFIFAITIKVLMVVAFRAANLV
jgi:hypothetical protein